MSSGGSVSLSVAKAATMVIQSGVGPACAGSLPDVRQNRSQLA